MKEGDIYWLKAFKDLEGDIKIGDGTVSMKDLKELDKKAGINTDNVMKNVKDGTELIGNWGFQGTDGFNMSLILKGDKTFETYGKGEYPNKRIILKELGNMIRKLLQSIYISINV